MAQRTDLPHTDCTCTVWPAAIWACAIRTNDVIWPIIREQQLSYGTLRPRPPMPPPIPVGQRVQMITCLCFVNTLALRARHHCACKDVPGEAQSLDDRSSFPKGKYSPSESESANNTCKHILTVQLFISHLPIFSHNLLTRHELNCFRINDTIAHLLCYFLEHFWSRIKVLHVCHLVVGNTNEILHQIRNYSLFFEVWRLVAILRLWRLEG